MAGGPTALVRTRRVVETDRELVARGFSLLAPETLHARYGHAAPDVDRVLAWMKRLSSGEDAAIGACVGRQPAGLARYANLDAGEAEVAVTVLDPWQGLGVGRILICELAELAWREGVRTLSASILYDNRRAIRLMRSIGATRCGPVRGGLLRYSAQLPVELSPPRGPWLGSQRWSGPYARS
jgi:GNAT superfamily N-acetyltransferase